MIDDGLSSTTVTTICQDARGFMWFGTYDGLNKFDGFEFTIYRNEKLNPASVSGNAITRIFEDSRANLWIGTKNGLDMYDPSTDQFIHYKIRSDQKTYITDIIELPSGELIISSSDQLYKINLTDTLCTQFLNKELTEHRIALNTISKLCYDSKGILWIAERSNIGLVTCNLKTGAIKILSTSNQSENGLLSNFVHDILEDDHGNMWIGTNEGLNVYNRRSGKFVIYRHDPLDSLSLSDNICSNIFQDSKNNIWIGTSQGGLNLFNRHEKTFNHFQYDKFHESSLNHNSVQSIYEDKNGIFWVGTSNGIGLSHITPVNFLTYRNIPGNSNTLSHNFVTTFAEDNNGDLWIGTDGGGLNHFERSTGHFLRDFPTTDLTPYSILALLRDSKNNLWVGSYADGVSVYNSQRESFVTFRHDPENPKSLSCDDVRCIFESSTGDIWIVTNGGGLNLLENFKEKSFKHFKFNPNDPINSIAHDYCLTMTEDSNGMLWIGSYNGLSMFNPKTATFRNFRDYDGSGLSDSWIYSIHEDSERNLWVGTSNGLNLLNRENWTFTKFGTENGMRGEMIDGILEDNHGNLWLSTNNGLVKFDYRSMTINNYTTQDGLQSNEFIHGSYRLSKTGEMMFGGVNGFTIFHPDSIIERLDYSRIIISGLKLLNRQVIADSKEKKHISETSEITLTHKQATLFSIEYTVFEYFFPEKIEYKYQLQNYHEDWIYAGRNRSATFTNLNAGTYMFRVVSTNGAGMWNKDGASIKIIILPPFWKTWQAYLIYIALFVLLINIYHRYSMKLVKLKTDLRSQLIEKEKAVELESLKSQFFTNISHEFRTPLTLILVPLKELISSGNKKDWPEIKENFHIMRRSAERLLRLVNQVIDFNKIEAGRLKLDKKEVDIVGFAKTIVETFTPLATDKHIILTFGSHLSNCYVLIDPDKLDMVIFNLLSNAFKFTPRGGEISVTVKKTDGIVEIAVMDTGQGIPADHIKNIFDRFYQVEHPHSERRQGAGIGLSLSKELVELHNGDIHVRSIPGYGTTFTVQLPTGIAEIHSDIMFEPQMPTSMDTDTPLIPSDSKDKQDEHQTVLIVEDDRELRKYLKNELKSEYTVIEAFDGKHGLQLATKIMPDLILSDVMMCEMNGLEFTKVIKSNELTSHIPIILLTARSSEIHQLEGLDTGADDYVTKPFNLQSLKARIRNMLYARKQLRERFSREIRLEPKDIVINSVDEKFLQRAISIIEEHIAESEFNIEKLSKKLGLSRSQLFRKLKGLISETPNEFIQTIRLKRAAQYLAKSEMSITEICYEVGFNYPSHFTKLFQAKFGVPPKDFRKLKSRLDM